MYCCVVCNTYKGDRNPPPLARRDGFRFFRPDVDDYNEHFILKDKEIVLTPLTNVGRFSIDFLELNRKSLRRLRELRDRVLEIETKVAEAMEKLQRYKIDRIPPSVRGLAVIAIREAAAVEKEFEEGIDTLLRRFARSDLLEADTEAEDRVRQRAQKSRVLRTLYPGAWRARKSGKT
jgi:hypothetical protein